MSAQINNLPNITKKSPSPPTIANTETLVSTNSMTFLAESQNESPYNAV